MPVLVVVAVLVALVIAAQAGPTGSEGSFGTSGEFVMPTADRASALSSTWYCAAGSAGDEPGGELTVVVANAAGQPRSGQVTWFPSEGERVVVPVELGARDVVSVPARDAVSAPVVSAVVEIEGGGVVVEHALAGTSGSESAPCASGASDRWFLANGATTVDAEQTLYLFNPFPDDAIVDISFATEQGRDEPPGLVGLPIDSGTTRTVAVGDFVRRRELTSSAVVARSGRLVVDRIQRFGGEQGRSGTSLTLAAPAPAEVWNFPDGVREEGRGERWHVYNPGDTDALVSLEVVPDEGEIREPTELTIASQARVTVDAAEDDRVPAGVGHSSTVRSLNGVEVVAEREVDARSGPRGWSSSLGSPRGASGWVLAAGESSSDLAELLAVQNPEATPVRFSVGFLGGGRIVPIEGLQEVELGPSARQAVDLGERIERSPLPLVVSADGPVVVARQLSRPGELGLSVSLGVPLR